MPNHLNPTRRDFLKKAATSSMLALSPAPLRWAPATTRKITLAPNDIILFQGDSITNAGRKKDPKEANVPNTADCLGNGYVQLAAAELLVRHAGKNLQLYNRGISGNRVDHLAQRWEVDCLALKPTVLSVLVGVNDFLYKLKFGYEGTSQTYADDYRALLARTRQQFPQIRLLIGEPFAVAGLSAVDATWYPAFKEYQAAARSIATQFDAALVPYQRVFDQAQKRAPGAYWTRDGITQRRGLPPDGPGLAGNA